MKNTNLLLPTVCASLMTSAALGQPAPNECQDPARCNLEEKCPMDGQASHRVGTEYAGTTEIGVFGHELLNGGEHTFRVRCNN